MQKFYLLLLFILISLYSISQEEQRGVTMEVPRIPAENAIEYSGRVTPPPRTASQQGDFPTVVSGSIIDSITIDNFIPAGSSYSLRFNSGSKVLEALPPSYNVTSEALHAIGESPLWLENDLFDIFRRLDSSLQDTYAQEILSADKQYRDEVAFQLANLSPRMLKKMDPGLLTVNVETMYDIEPDLQYVELLEYESSEPDWYTTTRYRVIDSIGDTVWAEIPKEIYYQWVVMPRLDAEKPKMDHSVHNEFWRSYIYNNADPSYPLLKEKLKNTKVLWDGRNHRWRNKDSLDQPVPFYDTLPAVAVVGRWVAQTLPSKASGNRPIQPNNILHEHNGNCGELQDLLSSGSRTAMYPTYSLGTWPGDHVWSEVYCPIKQKWAYYQVSWAMGPTFTKWDKTYPDKACIAGWRSDGYRWMLNHHYNPVFTLTVKVLDNNQLPVDGAEVFFFGAKEDNPQGGDYFLGTWGHTNEHGELTVQLGTDINYGFRADWEHGSDPSAPTSLYTLSHNEFSEGDTLYRELNVGGNMPETKINPFNDSTSGDYSVHLKYKTPYQTLYGGGYWPQNFSIDNCEYAQKSDYPGKTDRFVTNAANFTLYQNDTTFNAYNYKENISEAITPFNFPANKDYYITLSNEQLSTISQFSEFTAYLVDNSSSDEMSLKTYPNPFSSRITIEINFTEDIEDYQLNIYDIYGRLINHIPINQPASGKSTFYWDGRNNSGHKIANGTYFIELVTENSSTTEKVIFLQDK
ncbi:MAG: FlgD immunoglobulin-like domain containing protein [Bacteroidales bacterium]